MRLALSLFLVLAPPVWAADTLLLDHAMLVSMAKTKEPGIRITYTPERLEFRTRRSALAGWIDVVLTARFERRGARIQLTAQRLHAQVIGEQTGKRFEEARAGLLKLVDVESAAQIVEIHQGDAVHKYMVIDPGNRQGENPK